MKNAYALLACFFILTPALVIHSQTLDWAFGMGGTSGGYSTGDDGIFLHIDPQGNIYSIGTFADTVDFDPGPGTTLLANVGDMRQYKEKLLFLIDSTPMGNSSGLT